MAVSFGSMSEAQKVGINFQGIDNVTDEVRKIEQGLKKVSDQTKTENDKMAKSAQKTKVSWTEVNSALMLVQQGLRMVKQGYDFAKEGAEIEFTKIRFDRLSESIDTTAAALLGDLKTATRGMYSDMELMASATDFVGLGLANTHDEAVRLASVSAGLNMNMNQLVLTLTNMTTMRFDALGVRVDGFKEKVKDLEKAGYSADAAFKEAFLQQAEAQLELVGNAADSAAGAFMRFEASNKNALDELKIGTAEAVLPLIEFINAEREHAELLKKDEQNWLRYAKAVGMTGVELEQAGYSLSDVGDEFKRSEQYGRSWQAVLGDVTKETGAAITGNQNLVASMSTVQAGINSVITNAAEKYEETLESLQAKHEELEAKLVTLFSEWGTTDDEILNVTNALAENEKAQLDAADAMQEAIDKMILQQATAGLDAQATLEVARAMGMLDEQSYAAALATQKLKEQYDDGLISSTEYAAGVATLRDNINKLQDKNIKITVQTIQQTVGNLINQGVPPSVAAKYGFAEGTGGWREVPPGYPNDSYPVMVQSGEKFAVRAAGENSAGGGGMVFNISVNGSYADPEEQAQKLTQAVKRILRNERVYA